MRIACALAAAVTASAPLAAQQTRLASASAPAVAPRAVSSWAIDPTHSELTFRIRHLVGKVNGTFGEWSGTIVADPAKLADGQVTVAIKTASIDTRNADRDAHLRNDDFFAAAQHPDITFASKTVRLTGTRLTLEGDLTIRGVTRAVTLTGDFLGQTTDPWGMERLGFEVGTTIDRKAFGVSWNKAMDKGGVVLGDEVEVRIALEAVKQG